MTLKILVVNLKKHVSVWLLVLAFSVLLSIPANTHGMSFPESASLYTGDELLVKSDQISLQKVLVQGNITSAVVLIDNSPMNATNSSGHNVTLTSSSPQTYLLYTNMSYPAPYTATISLKSSEDGSEIQLPSYIVSSGDLDLAITVIFQARPGTGESVGWSSFYDWMGQFGGAFPVWVKVLFLVLGVQFAFVGYRWMKFEDERRRLEGHLPPLDKGNRVYLWMDILFRGLLTVFAISLAIMVGEVMVILIAKYLFFVDLSLVSLIDFFSLFFLAALGSIIYLAREGMDRLMDLKPMVED